MKLFIRALFALVVGLVTPAGADPAGRVEVVDGDTIRVGGETVRLFGIDAPERDQLCWDDDEQAIRCGEWATRVLERFAEGREGQCDAIRPDDFGRTLATCTVRGVDLGETLLRNGIVRIYSRETRPDYPEFEKEAELLERGIWAWRHEDPSAFRASVRAAADAAAPRQNADGCRIKGNISGSGRIYHVPGQENYDATRINTGAGERWFCTEAEARAAGWRRARR